MRKYVTLAKLAMQAAVAYRMSFLINMLGGMFFIIAMFYLWEAIYQGKPVFFNFTWDQMKTYLFIAYLSNSLLSFYSEGKIGGRIRSGEVAIDLLKPLDFQKARFAETIGTSIIEGGLTVILMVGLAIVFEGIQLPTHALTWVHFIISMLGAVVIKFGVVYLFALCCFWTDSLYGISLARAAVTNLFSGALVPFAFLPGWLNTLCEMLPFKGIVYVPSMIFLEQMNGSALWQAIGGQLIWAIVLWVLGALLYNRAVRQVTIYGG